MHNVVLEFGRQSALDAYILVANILTRRIHEAYVEAMERSMADDSPKPTPLVITIEEAHKFLSPDVADLTIFGTIAREMRKYNVTLLVVDQRPSEIDEELEAGSPGSIGAVLIPVERQNLNLARYLRKLDVENEDFGFGDGDFVDVFTFDPEEVLLSDGK